MLGWRELVAVEFEGLLAVGLGEGLIELVEVVPGVGVALVAHF